MPFDLIKLGPAAIAIAAALALTPTAAFAHGSMKPQHGGLVQMSGETMVELVASPKGVDIFISEEDEPLPASAYTATLTQTASGEKTQAALKPAGGNKLSAPGFMAAKGAKIVVTLTDPSGAKIFTTFQTR